MLFPAKSAPPSTAEAQPSWANNQLSEGGDACSLESVCTCVYIYTHIYYDACMIWVLARRNRRKRPDLGPGPNCEGTSDLRWACEGARFLARAKARVARKVDTDTRIAQTTG